MRCRLFFFIVLLVVLTSACTDKHFIETTNDSVTLYYSDSNAKEILFASSLDNFKYHSATKDNNGLWKVSVRAQEGFGYFYIVDGMVTLPACQYTENDDFGSKNCLYVIGM